jgi:hypothetical protein
MCRGGFLQEGDYLIKLGSKEVQGGDDGSIGTEAILLHNLLVVHGVPYIWNI